MLVFLRYVTNLLVENWYQVVLMKKYIDFWIEYKIDDYTCIHIFGFIT